ncbi:hypothetical protein RF11_11232 [Thelohanellus kitauei]|uniref:LysM domain-containing protein n=1 Tax=Thelohanellus kitauei TaxID=669202 RepID=A0A0C2MZY3_THEKT|nr:hypothetical protein RF11_11232 [Thelohanellus kitauei]
MINGEVLRLLPHKKTMHDNSNAWPENSKINRDEHIEIFKPTSNIDAKIALTGLSYATSFKNVVVGTESLAALAVKYNCTMSDIKLLNGLVDDSDLFGCRYIKVPISPTSVPRNFTTYKPNLSRSFTPKPPAPTSRLRRGLIVLIVLVFIVCPILFILLIT